MGFIGYYHHFEDLQKLVDVIKSILSNNIAIGKFIILHKPIHTKSGKNIGIMYGDSYILSTIFDNEKEIQKILKKNIIQEENFIDSDDIVDEEFDEFGNLKKATTLTSYKEFMNYVEKHNLK